MQLKAHNPPHISAQPEGLTMCRPFAHNLCAQPSCTTFLLHPLRRSLSIRTMTFYMHLGYNRHTYTHAQRTTDADTDIDRQTDRQESLQKLEEHFLRPPPGAERRTTRAQPRAQPAHNRAHNPLPNRLTDLQIHRLADSQITDSQTYRLTD